MKKLVLSVILTLTLFVVNGQELPNIVPQTPNTHSLGKYGEVPIGMFTGSPNINIPLHTVSLSGYSLPISLAYNSNGVKVDQYSSSVGLGWDLITGGVITRTVNDDPDEITQAEMPDPETKLFTREMLDFLRFKSSINGDSNGFDYQPDLFSFNFNGYSGQFFLKRNKNKSARREAVLLSASPLKIDVEYDGINFRYFSITDPSGVVYKFSDVEKSMNSSSCSAPTFGDKPYEIINAWHLTEITLINGEKLSLDYDSKEVTYDTGVSQSVLRESAFNSGQEHCPRPYDEPCKSTTTVNMLYIKSINTINQEVVFSYSQKEGMPSGMNKLDTVIVYDKDKKLLKKYILNYNSYIGNGGSGLNSYLVKSYHNIRFFLTSITEENKKGITQNPYLFEYINPTSLPSRFSFSQDHWGFFNGHSNINLISSETIEKVTGNQVLGNLLNNFKAANRKANFIKGKIGLLSTITYPTKGYTTLSYEPNSYSKIETVYPDDISKTLWADTRGIDNNSAVKTIVINDIAIDQYAKVNFLRELILIDESQPQGPSDDLFRFVFSVKDLTTGETICINKERENVKPSCNNDVYNSQIEVTDSNVSARFLLKLKKGHNYEFKVSINRKDTKAGFYIKYYNESPIRATVNKEVGGGRVFKTENFDNNEALVMSKKYHYNTMETPDVSSGFMVKLNTNQSILENEIEIHKKSSRGTSGVYFCNTTTLLSNTAFPVYGGPHVGYQTVIEELGHGFSHGGTEHIFSIRRHTTLSNLPILGKYIAGTPVTNHFGLGKPIKKRVFKKYEDRFLTISSEEMKYAYDDRLNYEITAYNIRRWKDILNMGVPLALSDRELIKAYGITKYSMLRRWEYLDQNIRKQFDENGENPITTTTNYFYENSNHLQPTRTEVTTSKGEIITTETKYAHDVDDQILINENRIASPLTVETSKKVGTTVTKLSTQNTVYKDFNGIYLPEIIQTLKGIETTTNKLQDRIVYHSYDTYGNPTAVSKVDGTKIYYVWGYNKTQPIAKIEGYTSINSDQLILINDAVTASNNDKDETTETTLRDKLKLVRDAFSAAQVTTFTYNPLIGVTSITDPREEIIYYEYDDFNRLKFIKNATNQILKEHEYNYKK